jgi:hypothetical protein
VRILVLTKVRVLRSDANVGREHQLKGHIPRVAVRDDDDWF